MNQNARLESCKYKINRFLLSRFTFYTAIVLFRVALDVLYLVYVSPVYAYSGFVTVVNEIKYVESWLLYLVLTMCLTRRIQKPSDFFVLMMFLGVLAPVLAMYGLADQERTHLYLVILGFLIVVLFRRGRLFRLPTIRGGRIVALTVSIALTLGILCWLIGAGGLSYFNLDLTRVYEFRSDVGAQVNVGLFGYLNTWVFKVFNIILLAWALFKRRYGLAMGIILLQVVFFGISSHKAVLFYPFVVLFVYLYFTWTRALSIVPLGMLFAVVASGIIYFAFDWGLPASLFIRRVYFVVANLTFAYYEFFSLHDFVYWSNSLLSLFIEYPYHLGPARLIGEWQGTTASANNTFLSTGYMHAGLFGIILYGALTGLLFRFIDSLASKGLSLWLVLAVTIIPMRSLLISADLPTALLTHGIGVSVLMLFLLRAKGQPALSGTHYSKAGTNGHHG